jgi:cytochrome c5
MRFILTIFLLATAFASFGAEGAEEDFDREEIEKRIAPIGKVHVVGKPAGEAGAKKAVAKAAAKQVPGQATYEGHCIVCHADGVAGAPKFRNAGDWQPRLAKSKIDELVQIAIKGLNAMPPKGTCTECSEEDIKNAIQYMLPKKGA